jgi:hypothetical protein
MNEFAAFYVIVAIFLFVLAIAWIVLPFAVIGTKPLLQRLIRETEETNKLLRALGTDYRVAHPEAFPPRADAALRATLQNQLMK